MLINFGISFFLSFKIKIPHKTAMGISNWLASVTRETGPLAKYAAYIQYADIP